MKTRFLSVGLVILGSNALAVGAIANPLPSPTTSMTDLELPVVENAVPSKTVTDAPKLAEVLPEGGFTDVSPTHWAYTAVTNLAEDYGCLAGYPDDTFRGEEFVTRYEFAAAMDACLGTLLELEQGQQTNSEVDAILEELTDLQRELGTVSDEVEEIDSE
ncbi:S-layer homology domain-containing protein [Oscillatoria sp. CS-180]|uniref:S-layer homology domain-containing protein n=1 Tax=Oscillatoria sp. CS-180 TaxID=3021720 RepID=UPI0023311946|nr:S-layer homology domain-containing protein [Oscillatoria sp. CS-180]MDB9526341.1 S-layer homology domain-containing protein [Oscillatoria sp. CS-180]